MAEIKFYSGENIPLELHKVRIVQKLDLVDVDRRAEAIKEAGNNTFLLKNKDIFLDMLTDSGVNAMSDRQLAAMMIADDSYAGSATSLGLQINSRRYSILIISFLPIREGQLRTSLR